MSMAVLCRYAPRSSPRKRGPIFQSPRCEARWVPAFAGTTHLGLGPSSFNALLHRLHLGGCRIGPAQRWREHHLDIAADGMAGAGAELERLEPAAERGELVDGLRALIAAPGHARSEAIVGLAAALAAQPHVLRPHRDLHRIARLDAPWHQRGEAVAAGIDGAELAVARKESAREQVGGAGEARHEQVGGTIVDLVRRRHL